MQSMDVRFSGSIPPITSSTWWPLLFRPYAKLLAERAAEFAPARILETAAGTGVVTQELAKALPMPRLSRPYLNQAMLDVAAERVLASNVTYREADALDLPFDDRSFDLVVCQFGVMFFPDKVAGHAEPAASCGMAARISSPSGTRLNAITCPIWRTDECNPCSPRIRRCS
jgi:hypothetical protein